MSISIQDHPVMETREVEKLLNAQCISTDNHIGPIQPLTFDRVNEGQNITSSFPWFQLPIELLTHVVSNLTTEDLATLSLIDRNCRQLARSVQFATIRFSFSTNSIQLLQHLCKEGIYRFTGSNDNEGDNMSQFFIGQCVRRFTIACDRRHVEHLMDSVYGTVDNASGLAELWKLYRTCICSIEQCIITALPNLELFRYVDMVPLPWTVLLALSQRRVKHILLDYFDIGLGYKGEEIPGMLWQTVDWSSVETLRINFSRDLDNKVVTIKIGQHLLKSISRTCRTLVVEGSHIGLAEAGTLKELSWPRLRRLGLTQSASNRIPCVNYIFAAGAPSVPSIHSLWVGWIDDPILLNFGHIPSLRKVIVEDMSMVTRDAHLGFLSSNPQLTSLSFTFPIKGVTIRETLLPLLITARFTSLSVLRLTSASTRFSRRALSAIGLITSLEKLWISAGSQTGWRYDWFIDHGLVQKALRNLRNLHDLAFTRESYHCEDYRNHADEQVSKAYYSTPILPPGVSEDSFLSREDLHVLNTFDTYTFMRRATFVWEKWHKKRMLGIATEYVNLFQSLNFLYLGEYPMATVKEREGDKLVRRVIPLSEERDCCLDLLDSKWGYLQYT